MVNYYTLLTIFGNYWFDSFAHYQKFYIYVPFMYTAKLNRPVDFNKIINHSRIDNTISHPDHHSCKEK